MKTLKAVIFVEGGNAIFAADVIRYKGKRWIVPQWLENPSEGWKTPERIVCLDNLQHQKLPRGDARGDFAVNVPIPRSVLFGPDLPAANSGYVVVRRPKVSPDTTRYSLSKGAMCGTNQPPGRLIYHLP